MTGLAVSDKHVLVDSGRCVALITFCLQLGKRLTLMAGVTWQNPVQSGKGEIGKVMVKQRRCPWLINCVAAITGCTQCT